MNTTTNRLLAAHLIFFGVVCAASPARAGGTKPMSEYLARGRAQACRDAFDKAITTLEEGLKQHPDTDLRDEAQTEIERYRNLSSLHERVRQSLKSDTPTTALNLVRRFLKMANNKHWFMKTAGTNIRIIKAAHQLGDEDLALYWATIGKPGKKELLTLARLSKQGDHDYFSQMLGDRFCQADLTDFVEFAVAADELGQNELSRKYLDEALKHKWPTSMFDWVEVLPPLAEKKSAKELKPIFDHLLAELAAKSGLSYYREHTNVVIAAMTKAGYTPSVEQVDGLLAPYLRTSVYRNRYEIQGLIGTCLKHGWRPSPGRIRTIITTYGEYSWDDVADFAMVFTLPEHADLFDAAVKAVKNKRERNWLYWYRVNALLLSGHPQAAKELLSKIRKASDRSVFLARIHVAEKEFDAANKAARKIRKSKQNRETLARAARDHFKAGHYDEALFLSSLVPVGSVDWQNGYDISDVMSLLVREGNESKALGFLDTPAGRRRAVKDEVLGWLAAARASKGEFTAANDTIKEIQGRKARQEAQNAILVNQAAHLGQSGNLKQALKTIGRIKGKDARQGAYVKLVEQTAAHTPTKANLKKLLTVAARIRNWEDYQSSYKKILRAWLTSDSLDASDAAFIHKAAIRSGKHARGVLKDLIEQGRPDAAEYIFGAVVEVEIANNGTFTEPAALLSKGWVTAGAPVKSAVYRYLASSKHVDADLAFGALVERRIAEKDVEGMVSSIRQIYNSRYRALLVLSAVEAGMKPTQQHLAQMLDRTEIPKEKKVDMDAIRVARALAGKPIVEGDTASALEFLWQLEEAKLKTDLIAVMTQAGLQFPKDQVDRALAGKPVQQVFVHGTEINLRARAHARAPIVATPRIGTACQTTGDADADGSTWIDLRCKINDTEFSGFTIAALVGPTAPTFEEYAAKARDAALPLGKRWNATTRAAALKPDDAAMKKLLFDGFLDTTFADLKRMKRRTGVLQLKDCAEEACLKKAIEEVTFDWHFFATRGDLFISVLHKHGYVQQLGGRLGTPSTILSVNSYVPSPQLAEMLRQQATPPARGQKLFDGLELGACLLLTGLPAQWRSLSTDLLGEFEFQDYCDHAGNARFDIECGSGPCRKQRRDLTFGSGFDATLRSTRGRSHQHEMQYGMGEEDQIVGVYRRSNSYTLVLEGGTSRVFTVPTDHEGVGAIDGKPYALGRTFFPTRGGGCRSSYGR